MRLAYFQEVSLLALMIADLAPSPPEGNIASFANARIYEHLLLNGMAQE